MNKTNNTIHHSDPVMQEVLRLTGQLLEHLNSISSHTMELAWVQMKVREKLRLIRRCALLYLDGSVTEENKTFVRNYLYQHLVHMREVLKSLQSREECRKTDDTSLDGSSLCKRVSEYTVCITSTMKQLRQDPANRQLECLLYFQPTTERCASAVMDHVTTLHAQVQAAFDFSEDTADVPEFCYAVMYELQSLQEICLIWSSI